MELTKARQAGLRVVVAIIALLPCAPVRGKDPAFQALMAKQCEEFGAAYQQCLERFPPNLKEQLRIAERAWIIFDNKNEAAFNALGKRQGMGEEDLEGACLPGTVARTALLRAYFMVPNADLSSLRRDLDQAEQELTLVYKQCLATLGRDDEQKLRDTERAWIDCRDKDARAHLGDSSGRAPVWSSAQIARRRSA